LELEENILIIFWYKEKCITHYGIGFGRAIVV